MTEETVGKNVQDLGQDKEFLDLTANVQSVYRVHIHWASLKLKYLLSEGPGEKDEENPRPGEDMYK